MDGGEIKKSCGCEQRFLSPLTEKTEQETSVSQGRGWSILSLKRTYDGAFELLSPGRGEFEQKCPKFKCPGVAGGNVEALISRMVKGDTTVLEVACRVLPALE